MLEGVCRPVLESVSGTQTLLLVGTCMHSGEIAHILGIFNCKFAVLTSNACIEVYMSLTCEIAAHFIEDDVVWPTIDLIWRYICEHKSKY